MDCISLNMDVTNTVFMHSKEENKRVKQRNMRFMCVGLRAVVLESGINTYQNTTYFSVAYFDSSKCQSLLDVDFSLPIIRLSQNHSSLYTPPDTSRD